MGRLDAPDTIPDRDPALIIGEGGVHYRCPDLASLAEQITHITHRLDSTATYFVRLLKMLERDRDLLLEIWVRRSRQEAEGAAQETTT